MVRNQARPPLAALYDLRKIMDTPEWLDQERPYLLGISGGRDSVFLLHWLLEKSIKKLTLCHLNHGLRGDETKRDEDFVRTLAASLDLPVLITHTDVAALAEKESLSLETAAREARHHFFKQCAQDTGVHQILLAHHADDQVETVLFRLLRGSSGLKGMQETQQINDLTLLRPLLKIRRHDITAHLNQRNISFCEDSSNADSFATRNRLRNEALPLLKNIMGFDPSPSLLRATRHQEEADQFLSDQLSQHRLLDPQGRLHLPTLKDLPTYPRRQAIHDYLKKAHISDLSTALLDSALSLLETDGPAVINLPGGLRLRRKESRLFISP